MAKPVRYPRKLRVKLEKIAAERDQREAEARGELTKFDPFRSFYSAFHRPGSVEVMHARADETIPRLSIDFRLKRHFREFAVVEPPWTEPDGSL